MPEPLKQRQEQDEVVVRRDLTGVEETITRRVTPPAASRQSATEQRSDKTLELAQADRIRQEVERRRRLRAQHLIEAVLGKRSLNTQIGDLCSDWAFLANSSLSFIEALRHASANAEPNLRSMCLDVADRLDGGASLSEAFEPWQEQVRLPATFIPILEQGERFHTPEWAIRQLAAELRRSGQIEAAYEYSTLDPGFRRVFGALCAALVFATISNSPFHPLACSLLCVVVAGAAWRWRVAALRKQRHSEASSSPLLTGVGAGPVEARLATARWGRTFAALWRCGVPIPRALEAAADSTQSLYYANVLRRAAERTRNGWSLRDSLAETRLLPDHLLNVIQTGETTGDIDHSMDQFADFMEKDASMYSGLLFFWKLALPNIIAAILIVAVCIGILSAASGPLPKIN